VSCSASKQALVHFEDAKELEKWLQNLHNTVRDLGAVNTRHVSLDEAIPCGRQ
jgi:hypothetical protein